MEGEDDDSSDDRAFNKKSVWARMSVVFAGPFFNFIMAFVFAFIIIMCVGYDKPVISDVIEGYAAEEAGIQSGDVIVKINHTNIKFYREIGTYSMFHPGETVEITYERDGERKATELTPTYNEESGSYLYGFISTGERTDANVLTALSCSAHEVKYWIQTTVLTLKGLFSGMFSANDLSGPVGIVQSVGNTYQESVETSGVFYAILNMLNWGILLSANLGVMNLLPLPALDGGRLLFLIVEAIRRKRIDPNKEGLVHGIGIILLFLLMFLVLFNDIRKIFM